MRTLTSVTTVDGVLGPSWFASCRNLRALSRSLSGRRGSPAFRTAMQPWLSKRTRAVFWNDYRTSNFLAALRLKHFFCNSRLQAALVFNFFPSSFPSFPRLLSSVSTIAAFVRGTWTFLVVRIYTGLPCRPSCDVKSRVPFQMLNHLPYLAFNYLLLLPSRLF
jgi:hypothetical protein